MAYKSLYRKYRPSRFEDVYGQDYIVKTLYSAIENNKIGHAYLFNGTRGTGKTTIAKIFAKMVNCTNMKNNKPCGKCEICSCENTDEIPDIIEIDAASNNGVDEIRELKNKIKLMPVKCKYKVYIIDEVHMLSTGAFNALLKTLEEPPEHIIFILATTEPQKLPITIISRCQRFDFKKISVEDIYKRLKYIAESEKIQVSDEALTEIAKISDGALRDAIGTLDQLSSYTDKIDIDDIYTLKGSVSSDTLIKLVNYYIDNDISNMLDLIDDIYNSGKNLEFLIDDMLNLFRNILISKVAGKYFDSKDIVNKEEIIKLSEKIDNAKIEKMIEKLEELSKKIKDSNYAKVLFEVCLLSDLDIDIKPIKVKEKKEEEIVEKAVEKVVEQVEVVEEVKVVETVDLNRFSDNKEILINNTIVNATSDDKKKVKNAFLELDKYLIDKKFKNAATILKDATVTAASSDHLLLTYKYASMVEENDAEIEKINKLVSKMLSSDYKVVGISEDIWKEKRPEYLKLKKENKLSFIEEVEPKIDIDLNKEIDNVDGYLDIFGSEIIEMEG